MKNTMDRILDFFGDHEEIFADCLEELDSYNGFLGDYRMYPMEELSEIYSGTDPVEILQRAFFGHDAESYVDSSGNEIYLPFNPNRDYFYFNAYGNLVSCYDRDYSDRLDEEAVDAMKEYRNEIYSIDNDEELSALFDELEAEDEKETEAE